MNFLGLKEARALSKGFSTFPAHIRLFSSVNSQILPEDRVFFFTAHVRFFPREDSLVLNKSVFGALSSHALKSVIFYSVEGHRTLCSAVWLLPWCEGPAAEDVLSCPGGPSRPPER